MKKFGQDVVGEQTCYESGGSGGVGDGGSVSDMLYPLLVEVSFTHFDFRV